MFVFSNLTKSEGFIKAKEGKEVMANA